MTWQWVTLILGISSIFGILACVLLYTRFGFVRMKNVEMREARLLKQTNDLLRTVREARAEARTTKVEEVV